MLNPSVCARCKCGIWGTADYESLHILFGSWACPVLVLVETDTIKMTDNPPAGCQYFLEHAVSESVNIDKKSETGGGH